MINGWNISTILPVGKSANSHGLATNCYYCTAASLQNLTTAELFAREEEMQNTEGGFFEDTKLLFNYPVQCINYNNLQEAQHHIITNLPVHQSVAFSYWRKNSQTGHMIIVFKAFNEVSGTSGIVTKPASGLIRNIDYQKENPQPEDGLLPFNEWAHDIGNCYIICR